MEPLKLTYMNGTMSSHSYVVFAYKDGIGLGAKVYTVAVAPRNGVGLMMYTKIRVRSTPWEAPTEAPEAAENEDNVVSFVRAKEKIDADFRTIWEGISWEKTREDYCSTFVERKAVIGLTNADVEKFLETHTPETEAKIAAEYLLSLAPNASRALPVDELAGALLAPYGQVFDGLKAMIDAMKTEAEIDKTTLGTFRMSTAALKKMKDEIDQEADATPDVDEAADAED